MSARKDATHQGDRPPLQVKGFRPFLFGLGADLTGDQIWFLALAWSATRAGGPDTASLVIAAGTVPRMFLMLWMGAWVDRVGAWRVAQTAQIARVLVMGLIVVLAALWHPGVLLLAVLALVFGVADAARLPAAGAIPGILLPEGSRVRGQGLVQVAARVAAIISGPVAGFALAAGGLTAAAAVNLILFSVALLCFRPLRSHMGQQHHTGEKPPSVHSGLTYVRGNRPVFLVLCVATCLNLALLGPLNIGLVLRSDSQNWSPSMLGVVTGVFGAASVLGALVSSRLRTPEHPLPVGIAWMLLTSLSISALGLLTSPSGTAVAVAVTGIALGPTTALLMGFIQTATPRPYMGRVMALTSFSTFGLTPVAISGFGFLAAGINLNAAFLITGASVGIVALVSLCLPSLRNAGTLSNEKREEEEVSEQ
ncbi:MULTISPECIES: MFS transporter [unclassified Streptomyces]|uniref:MFS transporter n=1 Tax=unclassified Streptomyces TaxID=2593676 RepID=UPI000823D417|nr:MFS transporter [Streptomyces sp. AmelKG-D3]MYT96264.1 MFS transporter [Streptomyces sp. SID8350]SCK62684.1 Major Facilitator Superfamily protein [Streptomyces sp. AmelKG-D3]